MNERLQQTHFRMSVVVTLAATMGCLSLLLAEASSRGDEPPAPPPTDVSNCKRCHTCEKPTAENVCLPPCTRVQAASEELASKQGPDFILLDMIKSEEEGEDRFGPVPFDHQGHAEWAGISGGCTMCHHYTPEGAAHPACRTCHLPLVRRSDITKPGLKGAYHRQCMGCHREWSQNTRCVACHIKMVGEERGVITREEALGHMGAPIPEPGTEIYELKSESAPGKKAIFRHNEHTHRFDLKCAECHQQDNCARCHGGGEKLTREVRSPGEDHHRDCVSCHRADVGAGGKCDRCHWKAGQSEPAPFRHVSTGWPLNRYHKDKSCRGCHKVIPFVGPNRDCNACHSDWEPDSFSHAVTGQVLDENHIENDCADCHAERRFDRPPSCEECHEEDEGISFPARRPGRFGRD